MQFKNLHLYDSDFQNDLFSQAMTAWELRRPTCSCEKEVNYDVPDKKLVAHAGYMLKKHRLTKRHQKFEEELEEWCKEAPALVLVDPDRKGKLFVDVCAGSAPTTLLFRQQFRKNFPMKPLMELLSSQKDRHTKWGNQKYHELTINIYNSSDLGGLLSLEVNLWEEIPDAAVIEEAAEAVRTGRFQLSKFPY